MIPNSQADITPPDEPDPPGGHVGEHVRALAKVSSDLAGAKLGAKVSMDALTQLAFVACTADVITWEEATDSSERERGQLYSRLPPRQARVLRKLITAGRPKAQMPKPAKPQFPEAGIGQTIEKHATLKTAGRLLMASRDPANFFAKLKYEAAAAEPSYTPYPAPNLLYGQLKRAIANTIPCPKIIWAPRNADAKRAIEADNARQKRCGAKNSTQR